MKFSEVRILLMYTKAKSNTDALALEYLLILGCDIRQHEVSKIEVTRKRFERSHLSR